MTNREFLGEEFFRWAMADFQSLNEFRNTVSNRRPTDIEKLILTLNKSWIAFYKRVLIT